MPSTAKLSYSYAVDKQITAENIVGDVIQNTSIADNAAVHDAKGNLTEYESNSNEYEVTYDLNEGLNPE